MNLVARIKQAGRELGALGMVSLALIAGAGLLHYYGVRPLEERRDALEQRLARQAAQDRASDARLLRDAAPAAKLAAFYRFFESGEKTTDRLAQLSTVAASVGVELRSAEYRMQKSGSRIDRYEITLPMIGSYARIRAFLEKALKQIPVLSLDQVSFRRNNAADASVQAEARLTLHVMQDPSP